MVLTWGGVVLTWGVLTWGVALGSCVDVGSGGESWRGEVVLTWGVVWGVVLT